MFTTRLGKSPFEPILYLLDWQLVQVLKIPALYAGPMDPLSRLMNILAHDPAGPLLELPQQAWVAA
eukprot:CAMPEP_0203803478 /NCGR_PEP_ID=MMETSP0100_2-20121128/12870_1 /ASSEMBLY_ACC=CAM_ASM_000210 /TAXON_ID=96639 /ORGANISM=" , Strain NY0313808BC1" /LENGTH=65 /DNA_ID=CAMNT_0050711227 /DNA_START=54 /DNA_END=247 /DNA_ORIENTATION=-